MYFYKSAVRREIKQHVISSDYHLKYTVFSFSKEDYTNKLEWVNDKEFIYEDFMYDIISIDESIEKIKIICIKDKFETLFKDYFSKFIANQRPNKSKNLSFSLTELLNFKYIELKQISLQSTYVEVEHFSKFTLIFKKIFLNIPSPPP